MEVLYILLEWSAATHFLVTEAAGLALIHLSPVRSGRLESCLEGRRILFVNGPCSLYCESSWSFHKKLLDVIFLGEQWGSSCGVRGAPREGQRPASLRSGTSYHHRASRCPRSSQYRLLRSQLLTFQDWSLLVLRVLRSWVRAIGRWFPNLEPAEPALSEGFHVRIFKFLDAEVKEGLQELPKAPTPLPITSVVSILHRCYLANMFTYKIVCRTKHLASSPHFPVRIITLDIVEAGLHAIKGKCTFYWMC